MMELLFLLLPVAALSGWYFGARHKKQDIELVATNAYSKNYLKGLNYILNEQQDKALEVFLEIVEVDSETVETHLALGGLFRRRGEVERAIRIHQNLMARPNLTQGYRNQALLELGYDYMNAGLFDRAVRLFTDIVESKANEEKPDALMALLDIYQQEKSWQDAIDIAKKLQQLTRQSMGLMMAQCYCELAQKKLDDKSYKQAKALAKKALQSDDHCVRASIILGDSDMQQAKYRSAIKYFKEVENQDPEFLPVILEKESHCYSLLGRSADYLNHLKQRLKRHYSTLVNLQLAKHLGEIEGEAKAKSIVLDGLDKQPSLHALHYLIDLENKDSSSNDTALLDVVSGQIQKIIDVQLFYKCNHCGLKTKTLFWHCPSCKSWSTIKPLKALEE
ncbi:MAG: lipopolysaccharide assembly protein LapB [Gammaproteobacteria bacterium]|nr:lipopolysaccharide assembly protein LapB [Gammaproteobacteria bacterium]